MQIQRPTITQEQRQQLSPQMIQSIRLLSLPIQELKEEIQTALESNPALEVLEDKSTVSLESMDTQADSMVEERNRFEDASDSGFSSSGDSDMKRQFMEGTISRAETLQEHLLWQLRLHRLDTDQRYMGETLIQNLDNDGFHKEEPASLFQDQNPDEIEKMTALVRGLEPQGCCTKNYRESLAVQAGLRSDAPPAALEIILHQMDLLEKSRHGEIQKKLKISDEELAGAIAFIRSLNPFPGRQYSPGEVRYVVPDVLVWLKDGEFVISINDEEIPVIGINPYFSELSEKNHDKATNSYIKEKMRDARFFIHTIHQRNHTLLKVSKSIIELQRQFFARGPKYLAPLTLKDIANEVGVHETTVSRIANKKYIQTDWGIFELRYFFTNSISGTGSGGSRYSKTGVKELIREIIENEENAQSDQDIANILAAKGIKLARRTVAKYRNELNMDSSFGRKQSQT